MAKYLVTSYKSFDQYNDVSTQDIFGVLDYHFGHAYDFMVEEVKETDD